MKILAIRLKNLTSIEGTVEVDFMAEPLHSAGMVGEADKKQDKRFFAATNAGSERTGYGERISRYQERVVDSVGGVGWPDV